MVRPGRDLLSGRVEVDETFVGGAEADVGGRQIITKSLVLMAAEERGRGIGRIRLSRKKNATRKISTRLFNVRSNLVMLFTRTVCTPTTVCENSVTATMSPCC